MTNQEAIKVIQTEAECVRRNILNQCDRQCRFCDLLLEDKQVNEAYDCAIIALRNQEHEKWHPINPDDLDSFPNDDRFVLVSFSNYEGVDIARWRMDAEGGMFCPGDEDYPYTRSGIYVNAWRECPERWTDTDVDDRI
ncbi:MAG: hypothetical protein LUH07_12635 [Lachnospiraceae bacterium]|nr:hypothetical protein [Lachnospiraceae bacterium]